MDEAGINQVVRDVFGNVKTEVINGWVSMRCPLATWDHETGRDSRASAGISIKPQGTSVFNCFTCSNKMPLHGLLRKYSNYTGEDLDDLIAEVEEEAYLGPRTLPEWGAAERDEEPIALRQSIYLDLYDSAAGHPYLADRGISDETARKLQLMIDPCDPSDGCERILFPVFSPTGELYGLSGRDTTGQARLKVRDYFGLRKAACVLGSHLIDKGTKHVAVVEGLFDYAKMHQMGFAGLAVMHSTMTERQAAIVRSIGKPTYLFYDADEAGQKGVANAGKLLYQYIPVMKVRYPEIWIEMSDGTEHEVKDPGELESEDVEAMVKDARLWLP